MWGRILFDEICKVKVIGHGFPKDLMHIPNAYVADGAIITIIFSFVKKWLILDLYRKFIGFSQAGKIRSYLAGTCVPAVFCLFIFIMEEKNINAVTMDGLCSKILVKLV